MGYEWKNKVVIITGAASGIGEKIVRLLMNENIKHIAVLDVAEHFGLVLENELNSKYGANKVRFYKCDVTNEACLSASFDLVKKSEGCIDVVINNAAIMNDSPEMYKKQIDINLTALVTGTLKAQELMTKESGGTGGTVMNVASVAGVTKCPLMPIYWATKAAVIQFSNCIGHAETYAKTGVRVVSVCYGATETSLLSVEKLGSYDKTTSAKDLTNGLHSYPSQSPEAAARGFINVYKNADSSSVWIVNAGKPPVDVTNVYEQFYDSMEGVIFKK